MIATQIDDNLSPVTISMYIIHPLCMHREPFPVHLFDIEWLKQQTGFYIYPSLYVMLILYIKLVILQLSE